MILETERSHAATNSSNLIWVLVWALEIVDRYERGLPHNTTVDTP